MLNLDRLDIRRVIVHHIPTSENRQAATPLVSTSIVELPTSGLDMFNRRIAGALGHRSHGIKVDFTDDGQGSFFQEASSLMSMSLTDEEFAAGSAEFAHRLCRAQGIKKLPVSKLLVMSGLTGEFAWPFLAVVKADMQDALAEVSVGQTTTVDYLNNVFLTESQRLFKIGFVQQSSANPGGTDGARNKSDYFVHLFDHLLTKTETRNAAYYFYADFLGADIAASDKRLTQDFFEKTQKFIGSRGYEPDKVIDLNEALRSELRSNDQTISVADFGKKHMGGAEASVYEEYMQRQSFPTHGITKNTEYIKSRLRRRQKITFSSGVMITTPADQIALVKIDSTAEGKTTVVIDGLINKQE